MTTYALVRPDNTVDRQASNVDPTVETKPGWRWLQVIETRPTFDPATQKLTGPVITANQTNVTYVWTAVALTAAELDAIKDDTVNGYDVVSFKILFNHENRIRVLEGKAPITAAQFRAAIKALL